ncbi:MAG: TonB-dependent receptor plug domain-containing protein [Taibaiella sp.]|nr:TonB-dependent receptor plug domain-containing protein [Taibaiella sp.]
MKLRFLIAPVLCATLSTGALAQDPAPDSLKQNTLLEGVEIVVIRAGDHTPFTFTNLYKKDIQKLNDGKSIPYILDQMPSVVTNSDDGIGIGYADMRIRGTDNQRINFTINGIPVNDAESQGTFFVNFPDLISSASSVQVQRGVGASTNGAGAFGASVNISNIDQSEDAGAEVINTYGSYNTWRHTIKAGTGNIGGGFNFDVRLSKISSDGYIDRGFSDLKSLQFLAGWTSADRRTSLKFNLFTGKERTGQTWNGVVQDSLETNRRYNELGLKEDGTYYDDQTDNYQQDYYQLFFNHKFTEKWSGNAALFLTRGRGYYNEYRMGEAYSDYGLPDYQADTTVLSETSLIRQLWLDNYFYGIVMGARYVTQ